MKDAAKELDRMIGKLTLGKLIWAIRKADNISQTSFAKQLGISVKKLNQIELDQIHIGIITARQMARILGYSEEQFQRLAK